MGTSQKISTDTSSEASYSSHRSSASRLLRLAMGLRSVLRGDISTHKAALELFRRGKVKLNRRNERALLEKLPSPPLQLRPEFQQLALPALIKHFRERSSPPFFAGFESAESATAQAQRDLFPEETKKLIESALLITKDHRWLLLGFGERDFDQTINWHRDPLSRRNWPIVFHADVTLWHNDGSDIRVLWELNRLSHFLTLGRAYALTANEQFADEFFRQLDSWRAQNPVGQGANWCCAMEVALRAMNLLGALMLFRRSPALSEERLVSLLSLLEQHGAHIRRNLEFSYIATGNHYLADIAGLLWLGIMLPELRTASEWRDWALQEMLREMDKQVLSDGANYEASTGYHRLVLELFLYSFVLCEANNLEIDESYWTKLESMLSYLQAYLRPDGSAPLIGDTDSGQVFPIIPRPADDHSYLLALGSVIFKDANLKPAQLPPPQEVLWVFGVGAVSDYESFPVSQAGGQSAAFPNAGTYLLRKDDLYLAFNASGAGGNGRGSHGHNDSLSIEVSACGRAFIVDPGSYVYTADLRERHLFRSTAYHSTVQVDEAEQNSTHESVPFVIGDEAHPRVLRWETNHDRDLLVAEHRGYKRFSGVTHRRTVIFDKAARWWLIEDELLGSNEHTVAVRFHFDASLDVRAKDRDIAVAYDKITAARLFVCSLDVKEGLELQPQFVSRDYGSKQPSITACWSTSSTAPAKFRWAIVPICAKEDERQRLSVIKSSES